MKSGPLHRTWLGLVLLSVAAHANPMQPLSGELHAGLAVIDITPPAGHRMCGYGSAIAEGADAPLRAKVLVLKTDSVSLALVATDLVWLYSDRIVTAAKTQWDLDHVILHGSHTHAGPAVDAYTGLDDPSTWYTPMEDRVIAAIGQAATNLFPARVRAGAGALDSDWLAYNRRKLLADGTVQMVWSNPSREPLGPIDPTVRVLRLDHAQTGEARAVLVHFAAHPVVLGSANRHFSPDYAGFAAAHVEQALGNGVVSMFLQGGGGDTHPFECGLSGATGFSVTRTTGASLGDNALRILDDMPAGPAAGPASLQVTQSVLQIARRGHPNQLEEVGVMAVLIDDAIALGVISGEPFVQLQLDLVAQSPLADTLLLGYSWFGLGLPLTTYLPTIQAVEEGGYGAATVAILEPAAGERMIAQAAGMLHHLHDPAAPLLIAQPLTLGNLQTGSREFTNTNLVNMVALPDPIVIEGMDYNAYQVTETGEATAVDPAAWKTLDTPHAPESFAMPIADGAVTLYAWYTNTGAAVQLQRAAGEIVFTRVAPPEPVTLASPPPLVTAGYTVPITGEALDAGSTGGFYDGRPIGIHRVEALCAATPSHDLTPDAPYVTVDGAGTYPVRLNVINMAGNATISSGSPLSQVVHSAPLPTGEPGDLFVARGNLGADPGSPAPFRAWAQAAPTIQAAIDVAPAGATVWVAPDIYRGAENGHEPDAFDNVVSIATPVRLRAAGARERTVLDGAGLRRGLHLGHAGAVAEGFTITNGFTDTAHGGGVHMSAGTLKNCLVTGNTTWGHHGGGVYAAGAESVITNCDVVGNTASGEVNFGGSGGGLRLESGAKVFNSRIRNNRAPVYSGNGGGVSIRLGATLIQCEITGNTAEDGYMTGGVFAHGHVVLRNCLVAGNGRGRVNNSAGIGSHAHGALNLQAVNCTLAGNHGAAIGTAFGGGNFYLTNTVAWANAADTLSTASGVMDMVNCLVSSTAGMTGGSGNVLTDPLFVDPDAGDYRLQPSSPCVNAGVNQPWMQDAFDLDGNRRVQGAVVDIGAYEFFLRDTVLSVR